jgi:hypothetical protein
MLCPPSDGRFVPTGGGFGHSGWNEPHGWNCGIVAHPPSQRTKMLIDIALVPVDVANRRQVEKLNAVFDRLSARRVDKIMLPELGSGFRASNLIRV